MRIRRSFTGSATYLRALTHCEMSGFLFSGASPPHPSPLFAEDTPQRNTNIKRAVVHAPSKRADLLWVVTSPQRTAHPKLSNINDHNTTRKQTHTSNTTTLEANGMRCLA